MLVLSILFCLLLSSCQGLDNGLALTPPMGWLSWARFGCTTDCKKYPNECISANLIKRTADRLVSGGYLDAGYEYLVIDNCWMEDTRAPDGRLVADRERFPLGMKDVADYVHNKGLKLGLYYGNHTCVAHPESMDIMKLIIDTFVDWEIDYVKLDACFGPSLTNVEKGYKAFGKLLNETGRDILYSCSSPAYQEMNKIQPNYADIAEICNMWRIYYNIDYWPHIRDLMNWYGDNQDRLAKHAGPGHWNDPDQLLIGNADMTEDKARVQMAVWAILAAPLLISTDLATIKPEFKRILLNTHIIDVNQDVMGRQGMMILQRSQIEVWKRELYDGSVAVAFVNKRDDTVPYTANFTHTDLQLPEKIYAVSDLYHEDGNQFLCKTCNFKVRVNPTGVKFYKFTERGELPA